MRNRILVVAVLALGILLSSATFAQADDVQWVVNSNDGSVQIDSSQPSETTCYAVPCTVNASVPDTHGHTLQKVIWEENTGGPYHTVNSSPWGTSWTYNTEGTYSLALNLYYPEGNGPVYSAIVHVLNRANQNTQITHNIPGTIYQHDNARNKFQVNYTGTSLRVTFDRGSKSVELTPYDQGTNGAWHYAKFQVTTAPEGNDVVRMYSGDKAIAANTQVVGAPVKPAFTNVTVGQKLAKSGGKCVLSFKLGLNANKGGSASLAGQLEGKLPNKKWQKLVSASKSGNFKTGPATLKAAKKFSAKQDPLATYLRKHSQFRFSATKVVIRKKDGTTALNLKKKRTMVSRQAVAACSFNQQLFSSSTL